MTEQNIKALCQEVERICGRSIRAASDYDYLSAQIYEKTHEQVSPSTLMRLFGYRSDGICKEIDMTVAPFLTRQTRRLTTSKAER